MHVTSHPVDLFIFGVGVVTTFSVIGGVLYFICSRIFSRILGPVFAVPRRFLSEKFEDFHGFMFSLSCDFVFAWYYLLWDLARDSIKCLFVLVLRPLMRILPPAFLRAAVAGGVDRRFPTEVEARRALRRDAMVPMHRVAVWLCGFCTVLAPMAVGHCVDLLLCAAGFA